MSTKVRVAFDTSLGVVFTTVEFVRGLVIVDGSKARQAVADAHGLPFDEVYDLVFYEMVAPEQPAVAAPLKKAGSRSDT